MEFPIKLSADNVMSKLLLVMLTTLVLLTPQSVSAIDGSIGFEHFALHESGKRSYVVDAQLRYQLSDYLHDSLQEGVMLISELEIKLVKNRAWWWDKNKKLATIKTTLQYHALSKHYQVIRLDTNSHWNFKSLNAALRKMGLLKAYRLPKLSSNIKSGKYHIALKANIKPDTLKFPMKIHSIFVDKYKIETPGVKWPLP